MPPSRMIDFATDDEPAAVKAWRKRKGIHAVELSRDDLHALYRLLQTTRLCGCSESPKVTERINAAVVAALNE